MKMYIGINGYHSASNDFDYKIMFFLNQGFSLLNSIRAIHESGGDVLYASLIKEIDDNKDLEVERRHLFKKLDQWMRKQRYNEDLINIQSGKGYKRDEFAEEHKETIKEFESRYHEFLITNEKYLSLIPPDKQAYYATINHILKYDDDAIGRFIDDEKMIIFKKLKEEALHLRHYQEKNLIPQSNF